jgi:hypothetical protein
MFVRASVAVAVLLSLTASGCGRHALLPAGATVRASPTGAAAEGFDEGTCQHLGQVSGTGKDFENASNDLRNKAAAKGANYVRRDPPTAGASFAVTGDAYRCDEGRGPDTREKPTGIAGFRLGASLEQARELCTQSGLRFESRDADATCTGTPVDLGVPGRVTLWFCSSRVCQIDVVLDAPPADYLETYRSLRNKLRDKYGSPQISKKDVDRCQTDPAECVVAGSASFDIEWRWSSKHSVALLTKALDGKARILVTYVTPERVAEAARPAF